MFEYLNNMGSIFSVFDQFVNNNEIQDVHKPRIVSIEGNIGAGKSTLLAKLEENLKNSGWVFMYEPVHLWETIRDKEGSTILKKFYGNPAKYAFAFQIMAYTTRMKELKRILSENPNCLGIICERSLEADKHIFAKMLCADGLIEDVEYAIYNQYFSEYEKELSLDAVIYLDTLPSICFQRILKRSRDGESGISLEYLQKCRNYHSTWLDDNKMNILYLDGNEDIEKMNFDIVLERVKQFLDKIYN